MDETWTPPPSPDPGAILNEARADIRESRQEAALAKLVWFHEHALEVDESFYGVRLSYSLSEWSDLAKVYPPAMAALQRARDTALADLRRDPDSEKGYHAFHDFVSINEQLGEEERTVAEFVVLDSTRPAAARRVLDIAGRALMGAREYALYGRHVDPEKDWLRAAEIHQMDRGMEGRFPPEHKEYIERSFTHRVTTLVAILVVNGRRDGAETVAQKARLEWDDPGFHAAIDHALAGNVPGPWP